MLRDGKSAASGKKSPFSEPERGPELSEVHACSQMLPEPCRASESAQPHFSSGAESVKIWAHSSICKIAIILSQFLCQCKYFEKFP